MKSSLVVSAMFATVTLAASAAGIEDPPAEPSLQKRAYFDDSYKIFIRKRNAHACMMSIVFIVLFPLAAISLHLPLQGVRVVSRIHAPIQILGLAMMIGAMGLGIDIAADDLDLFDHPIKAHVVIGLLTTSTLILFQPAMGLLQHRYYRRTGQKSVYAYIHRWLGRVAICLGWINSGLGFQLVGLDHVATHSLVRNFVIMGVIGGLWFLLMGVDGYRSHWAHKERLSSFSAEWQKGIKLRAVRGEDQSSEAAKKGGGNLNLA